jgi:hypothetical protein
MLLLFRLSTSLLILGCCYEYARAANPFGLESTADVSCIPYSGKSCAGSFAGSNVLVPNDLSISDIEKAMDKQGFNLVPFLK